MKKQEYQRPTIKVHLPSSHLLQEPGIGVVDVSNPSPIGVKQYGEFDEVEDNMWGRVWGRVDDE